MKKNGASIHPFQCGNAFLLCGKQRPRILDVPHILGLLFHKKSCLNLSKPLNVAWDM